MTVDLIVSHTGFAYSIADSYYLPAGSGDRDDLRQEALIGLVKAVRDYQPGRGANFTTFANLCIRRQVFTALTAARRQKQHSGALHLDAPMPGPDGDAVSLHELVVGGRDPHTTAEQHEDVRALVAGIKALNPLERTAILMVVNGDPYIGVKRIDNAVQRARIKLRRAA